MTDLTDEAVKALLDRATPGPWQSSAAAEQLPFGVMPRIYSADGTLLAEVGNLTLDQDAWEANAHLIAAAPGLARQLLATMDALAEAQKREASLRDAGERALRALKPFADRVFNDNGDCTISDQHLLTGADFTNAYQAHGKLRAALSAAPTGEESNG